MVWPLRKPLFRWDLVFLRFIWVALEQIWINPDVSFLISGKSGRLEMGFKVSSGQFIWILYLRFEIVVSLEERYGRSRRDFRFLYRSRVFPDSMESGGYWKDSWRYISKIFATAITDPDLDLEDAFRSGCLGFRGIYSWKSDWWYLRAFLFRIQIRRLLSLESITRFDLLSFLKGSDLFNYGDIWKLWTYKVCVSSETEISLTSHLSCVFLKLCFSVNLAGSWAKVFLDLTFGFSLVNMSQSSMLGKQSVEKSLGEVVSKMRIKIPNFDNSALIASFSKTVIGRCMNPMMQDMKTLLFMFPRIWQMEKRVVGSDLGMGKFQFDFESEEDISEVLKMEPFHFDQWMVSMVKWEPTVDPDYPSSLKFWIRVVGVPLQFRAELTFKSIGDALGKVVGVDVKSRSVQVILDGTKPLVFDTTIESGNGEETPISLWYEKLQGYCSHCFSLCHDVEFCEKKHGVINIAPSRSLGKSHGEAQNLSYKAAVKQDKSLHPGYEGKGKGIALGKEREEGRKMPPAFNNGNGKANQRRFQQGEASSKPRRFTNYAQVHDHRFAKAQKKADGASDLGVVHQNQAAKTKNSVKKSLAFETEVSSLAPQQVTISGNMEAKKVIDGLEMVAPTGQTSHHSDIELGEIIPASEGNQALTSAEFVNQTDLDTMDLAVAMETEAVLESEDETEALDRVLKEMEEAIAAGEIIPMEELPSSEGESDSQEVHVEGVDTEVELLKSDDIPVSDSKEGDKPEIAFADLGEDMEPVGDEDIGNGKEKGKEVQVTKRRPGKGLAISGVNSRKRNVQTLVSPRKRTVPKGGPTTGNESHPKDQGKEKGGQGGSKPPKP